MKNHIPLIITGTLLLIILTGCCGKKQHSQLSLEETDSSYSAMSAHRGMNATFTAMFDTSGVLLRSHHLPFEGLSSITEFLRSETDTGFILTWVPSFSRQSSSADLGYTYGTYLVRDKNSGDSTATGTYCTIWVKQADGTWKAVLDTGNPGLGMDEKIK
jgi:ketosteroid isomerase-like protein